MAGANGALGRYAARLNDTSWPTLLGYAAAAFVAIVLLRLAAPDSWRAGLKACSLALPLLLIAAKDLSSLPDVAARLRVLRRQGGGIGPSIAACLPPGLVGLARLDRAIWRGFFDWVRRRPQPARPEGLKLTFLEQGAYSTAIAIGLFALLVELPLDMAILPLLVDDPDTVRTVHLVFAAASLYSLAWLLGDRWLVRGGYHVLTATDLDLQVGARASARIPLAAIADAQALRQPPREWAKTHPFHHREAVNITPFDKPNLVLRLREDVLCAIVHHGVERTGVRYVFLYLDRPERLTRALAPSA